MDIAGTIPIFLEPQLHESAVKGAHNFIAKLARVIENAGFRVEYRLASPENMLSMRNAGQRSLVHMGTPAGRDGLVFRRVYEYPFWQIEQTQARWEWDVARAAFDPSSVPEEEAQRFYAFWQKRLYEGQTAQFTRGKYIYVPLQGRLLMRRSFQKCTPLEMLSASLKYAPDRDIVATLHPKETYSTAEMTELETLVRKNDRLSLARGDMIRHLQECDFVVTMNSAAAFAGYFFGKAALLFGKIDFHHIAVSADMENLQDSFARAAAHRPDFARYLWWFWQEQSINAGRGEAEARIAARLRRFGWPMQ